MEGLRSEENISFNIGYVFALSIFASVAGANRATPVITGGAEEFLNYPGLSISVNAIYQSDTFRGKIKYDYFDKDWYASIQAAAVFDNYAVAMGELRELPGDYLVICIHSDGKRLRVLKVNEEKALKYINGSITNKIFPATAVDGTFQIREF